MPRLLEITDRGLYCAAGDFYIDPWRPVPRAVITHAHSDHARAGSQSYLYGASGVEVLRARIGDDASIEGVAFGETVDSQRRPRVAASRRDTSSVRRKCALSTAAKCGSSAATTRPLADRTCDAFEPVRCHVFITESTFGLPIYRWRANDELVAEVNDWWRSNQEPRPHERDLRVFAWAKRSACSPGSIQSIGPLVDARRVERFIPLYRAAGIELPDCCRATSENARETRGRAMVIAPPSAADSPWLRKFGDVSTAAVSGWMQIRGTRRRQCGR